MSLSKSWQDPGVSPFAAWVGPSEVVVSRSILSAKADVSRAWSTLSAALVWSCHLCEQPGSPVAVSSRAVSPVPR